MADDIGRRVPNKHYIYIGSVISKEELKNILYENFNAIGYSYDSIVHDIHHRLEQWGHVYIKNYLGYSWCQYKPTNYKQFVYDSLGKL